jgi:hypothetical protein
MNAEQETILLLRDRNPLSVLIIILCICAIVFLTWLIRFSGMVMLVPIVVLMFIILSIRFRSIVVFKDRIEIVRKGLFPGLIAVEQIFFKDMETIVYIRGSSVNSNSIIFHSRTYKTPYRLTITYKNKVQRDIYSIATEKEFENCFRTIKNQLVSFQTN